MIVFLYMYKSYHSVSISCFRYLGLVSSLGASVHRDTCGLVPGLVYEQVELCRNSPDTITCVGEGVRRGIYECQSQFKFERWNCTTTPNQSVFGPVLNNGKTCDFIKWPLMVCSDIQSDSYLNYPPQRSCGQGNIFAPVCHSVHRGGVCLSACWDTTPPWSRHPPLGSRLWHTVNERPVRILLECILVYLKFIVLILTLSFKKENS